jgi:transposase
MQIQLKADQIWLANESIDFRKGVNGLCNHIISQFNRTVDGSIYIFYNHSKDKLKLLAHHRNGFMLIYKRLDKKKFTIKKNESGIIEINEKQLSWLLAGLNWVEMSEAHELVYDDYF